MSPPNAQNILIIGGSNTGLMIGVMLKRLGHNVHILEQNSQAQRADLAAGITTHPLFEQFMERHDRNAESWHVDSPGIQFLDRDAAVKRCINRPLKMTSWGVIYHHLRANFDGVVSNFCSNPPASEEKDGSATFDGGKYVTGIYQTSSGVEVTYKNLLNNSEKNILQADLVILADGANSRVRSILFPSVERVYAGYVAFRGTVDEADVSEEAKKAFDQKLTYQSFKGGYILLYVIPGTEGSIAPGRRRYNWVWYHPLAANSVAFTEIMTDTSGKLHRNTLPTGAMQLSVWESYVALATERMNKPFAEMVYKTKQPFITAIHEVSCPRATAWNGKVIIAGEALNLMRPHMALSTTQSATHALLLERVFKGEIMLQEWEKKVLHQARVQAYMTNAFGTFFLYGYFRAAGWLLKLASAYISAVWPFSLLSDLASNRSHKRRH